MRTSPSAESRVAARVSPAPDALLWLRWLVSLAFVLLLPLLLISTSLRALVTDRDLMLRGFQDNNVTLTTGLDEPQLERIADAFVAYFQGPPGQIQMQVTVNGQPRPLFNQREVDHMQDVQALIQWFLRMQVVAAIVVVARVALAVVVDREPGPLGAEMLWSMALMIGIVVLVGVLSLIDFDALWTRSPLWATLGWGGRWPSANATWRSTSACCWWGCTTLAAAVCRACHSGCSAC